VLLALAVAERTPWVDAAITKVIGFLRAQRAPQGYWTDKWHASPYYATACVIQAFVQAGQEHELTASHEWVLATQRDDGSWGYFGRGNAEETSYALMILLASSDRTRHPIPPGVVGRAIEYLAPFVGDRWNDDMEPLWINKTLYTPKQVVQSVILQAFVLAQHHLQG
jgi:squalene cyclase